MDSRRKNQYKTKRGVADVKEKLKENFNKNLKNKRHDKFTNQRQMDPESPPTTLKAKSTIAISKIQNRSEKLDAWRLEKNRKRLQEIQDHRSPFQSGKY